MDNTWVVGENLTSEYDDTVTEEEQERTGGISATETRPVEGITELQPMNEPPGTVFYPDIARRIGDNLL
jgi:hypothetical protein